MPNSENLKPFKPGNDDRRNLNGAPMKIPAIGILLADQNQDGIEATKEILLALVAKAKKGDTRAAEIILDRAYGKVKQGIDVVSPQQPTNIIFLGRGINPEE